MQKRVVFAALLLTLALLVSVFVPGCEERTNRIRLGFGEDGEGLDGFLCTDATGAPLLARALDPGGTLQPIQLVVDFVDLGGEGAPGCRGSQIIRWCTQHECRPIGGTRACLSVTVPGTFTGTEDPEVIRDGMQTLFRDVLAGEKLATDAPGGTVLVRLIATTESCETVLAGGPAASAYEPFDPASLLGCAFSSPVGLRSFDGELFLGFDAVEAGCTAVAVNYCARIFDAPGAALARPQANGFWPRVSERRACGADR